MFCIVFVIHCCPKRVRDGRTRSHVKSQTKHTHWRNKISPHPDAWTMQPKSTQTDTISGILLELFCVFADPKRTGFPLHFLSAFLSSLYRPNASEREGESAASTTRTDTITSCSALSPSNTWFPTGKCAGGGKFAHTYTLVHYDHRRTQRPVKNSKNNKIIKSCVGECLCVGCYRNWPTMHCATLWKVIYKIRLLSLTLRINIRSTK